MLGNGVREWLKAALLVDFTRDSTSRRLGPGAAQPVLVLLLGLLGLRSATMGSMLLK
jgi:hypothetical protein